MAWIGLTAKPSNVMAIIWQVYWLPHRIEWSIHLGAITGPHTHTHQSKRDYKWIDVRFRIDFRSSGMAIHLFIHYAVCCFSFISLHIVLLFPVCERFTNTNEQNLLAQTTSLIVIKHNKSWISNCQNSYSLVNDIPIPALNDCLYPSSSKWCIEQRHLICWEYLQFMSKQVAREIQIWCIVLSSFILSL